MALKKRKGLKVEQKKVVDDESGFSTETSEAGSDTTEVHHTKNSRCAVCMEWTLIIAASLAFMIYIVIPLVIYLNPWIMTKIVFFNKVKIPPFFNLQKPQGAGLEHTRNFYLKSDENIVLGIWHSIPQNLSDLDPNIPWPEYEPHLVEGDTIILYCHGNGGTRGGWHRAQLYKVLYKMNYHVVALDYRGYGDSSGSPTEQGLVHDTEYVYRWLYDRRGRSPLFVWGHSLGSGVATKLVKKMSAEGLAPDGLVLESPFTSLPEAALYYPLSLPWRLLPCYKAIFVDPLETYNVRFNNTKNIEDVKTPVIILHARDDGIVPYKLGVKVYNAAKRYRPSRYGPVTMISFDAIHGFGHKHIHKSPRLPGIVRQFFKDCLQWKMKKKADKDS